MTHLANAAAKRQDTSRNGRYHNRLFKETAEAMGLRVARDAVFGWNQTVIGPELRGIVKRLMVTEGITAHPFKYRRRAKPTAEPSLVKLTASCGVFAYVTRAMAEVSKLQCGECGQRLSRTED